MSNRYPRAAPARREVSLDEKLRYLKEIESIHRLSKKVLPPEGTTWARIADKHLQRALGMPIAEGPTQFDVKPGMHMHQHDPRTARVVERTLRNGVIHPHALHSFRNDGVLPGRVRHWKPELPRYADDHDVGLLVPVFDRGRVDDSVFGRTHVVILAWRMSAIVVRDEPFDPRKWAL